MLGHSGTFVRAQKYHLVIANTSLKEKNEPRFAT